MREAGKAIDSWESKVVELKKEHGEEPTTGLKASLLLEMLPDQVQLTVAQGLSSKKLDFDTLKAKIKLMANVQSDYSTPQPMDTVEMQCYDEDVNVEAVRSAERKRERSIVRDMLDVWWQSLCQILSKGEQQGSERFRQWRRQGQGQREADQSNVWALLDLRRQLPFEGVSERRWQQCKGWRQKVSRRWFWSPRGAVPHISSRAR